MGRPSLPHRHPLGLPVGTTLPEGALAARGEGTDAGRVAGPRRHGHGGDPGAGARGASQMRDMAGHGAVGVQVDAAAAVRADVRGCVRGTEDAHGRVSAFQTDTLRPSGNEAKQRDKHVGRAATVKAAKWRLKIGDAVRTPSVHLPVTILPSNGPDFLASRALLCRASPLRTAPRPPVSELRHGTVNNRNYSPGELPIVRLVGCRAAQSAQLRERRYRNAAVASREILLRGR